MPRPEGPGDGRNAAVVLPCDDLDSAVAFFTEKLGFRIDLVFPADNPSVVEVSGHGLHLRLQRGAEAAKPPLELAPLKASFVLSRLSGDANWHIGRAGMRYRDLIPGRQGGHIIASHIQIPDGGPVADYVHFHLIHFQMIFCYKGWVRVVYEDQGPPFVLQAGDCVLQPPRIRHRVLESSPGLEVIEVSTPAEHETRVDHDLALPTEQVREDRDFSGQRFLHHVASAGEWTDWGIKGFKARDTGIAVATGGLAAVRVVRPVAEGASTEAVTHRAELLFLFVLHGEVRLRSEGRADERLTAGASVVVPAGMRHALSGCTEDLELLEVCLQAR